MNKAFVKEVEASDQGHCPRCGSLGEPVSLVTLQAHLPPEALRQLAETACFCPFPRCEVAYFDVFERVVAVDALLAPVYPKDSEAPICACFGLTTDDIEQDVLEGTATRVKELLAKAKSPAARCTIAAASGHSCVAEVQKYYIRFRASHQASG
jgi:bacterioferritin-associated ferredoxin